jgi:hypothetical protein
MSRTRFLGNGKHNPHGTALALLTGGLRTRNAWWHRIVGMPSRWPANERASRELGVEEESNGKRRTHGAETVSRFRMASWRLQGSFTMSMSRYLIWLARKDCCAGR